MTATPGNRRIEPGDIVETSGRHVGDTPRAGEIVAVLGRGERVHFRVRWQDGHESILYPGEAMTIRAHVPVAGWAD